MENRVSATGQTGAGAIHVRDFCRKDLEDRAKFAFDALIRAHEAVAPECTDATTAMLKQELRDSINTDYNLLKRIVEDTWHRLTQDQPVPGELTLMPFHARIQQRLAAEMDLYIAELKRRGKAAKQPDAARGSQAHRPFVNAERIEALKGLRRGRFDLSRVTRMCEELNDCSERGNAHATIMLTRAILDHVPPVFGVKYLRRGRK
jgi:hypothetical protein